MATVGLAVLNHGQRFGTKPWAMDRQPGWVVSTPVAALAGTLAGLSLAPLGWPPLLWLALVPLWGQSLRDSGARGRERTRRRRLGGGPVGGHGCAGEPSLAVVAAPTRLGGIPLPLSLPVCLALWLGCGLAAAILVALWSVLVRWLGPRRWSTAVLTAAIWGLAEVWLSRSPLFWIGLGTSPCREIGPLAGLGALGGAALVAAAQLLIAWLLWRALEATAAARVAAKVGRRRSGNRSWWLGFATLTAALHLLGVESAAPRSSRAGGFGRGSRAAAGGADPGEVRTGPATTPA